MVNISLSNIPLIFLNLLSLGDCNSLTAFSSTLSSTVKPKDLNISLNCSTFITPF